MKKTNPKNKVTLDNLAGMVKRGFDSIEKKQDFQERTTNNLMGKIISVEEKFETVATKKDVDNLRNSVDKYLELGQRYYQEMMALIAKVDRHERWIYQIAEKMGVELKP